MLQKVESVDIVLPLCALEPSDQVEMKCFSPVHWDKLPDRPSRQGHTKTF